MRLEKFIIWLLAPFGFLLVAGGFAFQQFQVWAASQPASPVNLVASLEADKPSLTTPKLNNLEKTPSHLAGKYQEIKQQFKPNPEITPEVITLVKETKVEIRTEVKPPLPRVNPEPKKVVLAEVKQPEVKKAPLPATPVAPKVAPKTEPQVKEQVKPPAKPQVVQVVQTSPEPKAMQTTLTSSQPFEIQPVLSEHADYLLLDFDAKIVSEQNLKRAIARVLLSPDPYAELSLISRESFSYKERPAYYRQVISHKNQPIRYPAEALDYADFLVKPYLSKINKKENLAVKIPLRESNLAYPARRYESWVMQFAKDFRVSPALVLAIMETESNFNPKAVSRSQAKGLMQIKPNSAGRDVYKHIDLKFGAPSDAELFDEASNIRMGTAYLSLLKYEYFADIRNPEIKEMIAISSYNGGLSTVWKLFGATPEAAIVQINRLRPQQVYRKLRYEHASDETRKYIDKVLQAKTRYQVLLGEDARVLAAR